MQTRRKTERAPRVRQPSFPRHGGARRGAGRKPKGARARVSHRARGAFAARYPVLVTLKTASGQPSLRRAQAREVVFAALAAARERLGMRVVHFSIQTNHVHALVEAGDARALSRGMQGLAVRIARALNRLWKRRGRSWCDRFHSRVLRTPREVRNALVYVLHNARKHGATILGIDPCSSGGAFNGWSELRAASVSATRAPPVVRARTWLLSVGWRRHGRISIHARPCMPARGDRTIRSLRDVACPAGTRESASRARVECRAASPVVR